MPEDEQPHPEEVLDFIEAKNVLKKFGRRVLIGAAVGALAGAAVAWGVQVNRRLDVLSATEVAILNTLQDQGIIQNLKFGK
jgi:hypothetical protein